MRRFAKPWCLYCCYLGPEISHPCPSKYIPAAKRRRAFVVTALWTTFWMCLSTGELAKKAAATSAAQSVCAVVFAQRQNQGQSVAATTCHFCRSSGGEHCSLTVKTRRSSPLLSCSRARQIHSSEMPNLCSHSSEFSFDSLDLHVSRI